MRWLLPLPLALLSLATPTRADLLAEKAPAELTGSKTVRVTETRGEEILSVGKRASAGLRVSVPARPDSDAKKKIAPGGWYLVVEADLRRAKADADVRVRWKDAATAWEAIDRSGIRLLSAKWIVKQAEKLDAAPPRWQHLPTTAWAAPDELKRLHNKSDARPRGRWSPAPR